MVSVRDLLAAGDDGREELREPLLHADFGIGSDDAVDFLKLRGVIEVRREGKDGGQGRKGGDQGGGELHRERVCECEWMCVRSRSSKLLIGVE